MSADERVTVGLVRGLHGLRGAVRVEVLSDEPERFAAGSVVFVDGDDRPLVVAGVQASKPGILVRFEGHDSRESVEALRERYLEATIGEPLPSGTYYWHQLRGLEARTTDGEILGTVTDVFRAGEGEVYVVSGGPRGEVLVPAVRGVVTELDPTAGHVLVDAVVLALPDKPRRRRRRHEQPNKARRAAARAELTEARAAKAGKAGKAATPDPTAKTGEPAVGADESPTADRSAT
jgi:16S rRNA processing protein RimM